MDDQSNALRNGLRREEIEYIQKLIVNASNKVTLNMGFASEKVNDQFATFVKISDLLEAYEYLVKASRLLYNLDQEFKDSQPSSQSALSDPSQGPA